MKAGLSEILAEYPTELSFREDVGGRELTTFGVGGLARGGLLELQTLRSARSLKSLLFETRTAYRLLGAGSNVVFPDSGLETLLLRFGKGLAGIYPLGENVGSAGLRSSELEEFLKTPSEEISQDAPRLLVLAGTPMMSLSRKVSQIGLSGLEFAAGIPGTLGGAVFMNAGAHGHATEEVIHRVYLLGESGELLVRSKEELSFRYRHADLPENSIVIAAELRLIPKDPKEVSEHRASCLEYRRRTQPLQLRSAGSVFRNPPGQAAGALLEKAGLKGVRKGAIRFSELHANWLVCEPSDVPSDAIGLAEDIRCLVELGRAKVLEEYGISLETEIIFW